MIYNLDPENTIQYKDYEITITPQENGVYDVSASKDGEVVYEKTEEKFIEENVIKVTQLYLDDIDYVNKKE